MTKLVVPSQSHGTKNFIALRDVVFLLVVARVHIKTADEKKLEKKLGETRDKRIKTVEVDASESASHAVDPPASRRRDAQVAGAWITCGFCGSGRIPSSTQR